MQTAGVRPGASSLKQHSLFTTLKSLRGNPRGIVFSEPLWGIPYNLYAPYVSVYMLALGLKDQQIGLIVSVSWGFQVVLALLSGMLVDKLGRRRTTLIADILSWSVPALISALAQNFWYFLAAGMINSIWRVSNTAWNCLLVEDADQSQLGGIFSWIYIANILVGFIAPLTAAFIGTFSLVPTMRGLYVFAAVMFTVKAIVTYRTTSETRQGEVRKTFLAYVQSRMRRVVRGHDRPYATFEPFGARPDGNFDETEAFVRDNLAKVARGQRETGCRFDFYMVDFWPDSRGDIRQFDPGRFPNGLTKIRAELDTGIYPIGIKVADDELAAVKLKPAPFHGDWNYSVLPQRRKK